MSIKNFNGFLHALQICDSLFPVGAYTLSNGLETYVQKDIITSPEGLQEYLSSYISILAYNELGVCALSYDADEKGITKLDELYSTCKSPSEIRQGSQRVASRFLKASESLNENCKRTKMYKKLVEDGKCKGHQCIAYGLYFADCGVCLQESLSTYAYSICSAIVTNCVKLVPLSQLAGQRILAESIDKISLAVERAMTIKIDEIGVSGAGFDLRAMQHEKLYSRQYMS